MLLWLLLLLLFLALLSLHPNAMQRCYGPKQRVPEPLPWRVLV
jgi:hypothetical protein